jgi:hypothetical protein
MLAEDFDGACQEAMAAGGDLGILEGRTLALIHPAAMFFLFGATGWAGYLGWQHRRTRTIGEEISALKKALPAPAEGAAAPSTPEIDALVAVRSHRANHVTSGSASDSWENLSPRTLSWRRNRVWWRCCST